MFDQGKVRIDNLYIVIENSVYLAILHFQRLLKGRLHDTLLKTDIISYFS